MWNSWKRQLLSDLFEATEEVLRLGHKQRGRSERIESKQAILSEKLKLTPAAFVKFAKHLPDAYWIAEPDDILERNARLILDNPGTELVIDACYYAERGATLVTVLAADHPGLFYRIAGAIHLAGGNIIDARVHTSADGMAVDNFLVQDPLGRPFQEASQIERLERAVEDALANRSAIVPKLEAKTTARSTIRCFQSRSIGSGRQQGIESIHGGRGQRG